MITVNLVRGLYVALSLFSLVVLATRWRVYALMTRDRRWLFLALAMELISTTTGGLLKLQSHAPADVSIFGTVLTQAAFAAYLHHSVPRSFRRWPPRKERHG